MTVTIAVLVATAVGVRAGAIDIGAKVKLTTNFWLMESDLRTGAGIQSASADGDIVDGPLSRNGERWWRVDFAQGADGWVKEAALVENAGAATHLSSVAPAPALVSTRGLMVPTVSVAAAATGTAAAFANPDDGDIPDRALHPLAFPTATGFGKNSSVRSPDAVVYKINTREDVADPADGKISYRECALALPITNPYIIPADRPRYCVFDVAGAIILQSPAFITQPKIYIAGQTSPGGIEFRLGQKYNPVDSLIDTRRGGNHMILRHVRTRTGPHLGRESQNGDPIRMSGTNNQILDHVSTMFGTDESLDMACTDCTVQWSIIGPNICRNAGHTSSLHCKTFFLKPATRVTIAHNLSQHGEQRGINIAAGSNPAMAGAKGQFDVVNNVLYNFIAEAGLVSNQFGSVYANYLNNVYLRGPKYNASDGNYLIGLYANASRYAFGFNIFSKGNVTPRTRIAGQFGSTTTDSFQNSAGYIAHVSANSVCGLTIAGIQDCSHFGLTVVQNITYALMPGLATPSFDVARVTSAQQAFRDVMTFAGANQCLYGACRDNVDAMYIDDVRTCDTAPYLFDQNWPSTVSEAGGWARLTQRAAKLDSDNDGMPDDWEKKFRNSNPHVWDANDDRDGDGYPNIEEYLNALAQDHVRYDNMVGKGTGVIPAYNCGRPMF
ncbi:hypothetical protein DM806_24520 [Sphingobium lactosutens]|uniref:hypothetical protein n=1 Tax=Sphingobium lactosutens TaxID=522773 RepID=UPI0015C1016F|nr:hypothetical protein [Sphingobium lactosutens]NWK98768.1 hypothetical protein [Sphingobium lactosutens]